MNTARVLNYNPITPQVVVLPFGKGKKRKVSNLVQPVREVTVGERISSGGTDPIGGLIFVAEYADGKKREILVPSDGPLLWEETVFLKEGRTTTDPTELFSYEVRDPNDQVPPSLIKKLKTTLAEHNAAIRAAADARYSKKPTP